MGAYAHRSVDVAQVDRLLAVVERSLGGVPVWLAASGVETGRRGTSEALQARDLAATALRAYRLPTVEVLLHALVQDAPRRSSGLFTRVGAAKMAANAFSFPLAQNGRRGESVLVWGQVRPRDGRQRFRLQLLQGGETAWLGGVRTTSRRGYFTAMVKAPRGGTPPPMVGRRPSLRGAAALALTEEGDQDDRDHDEHGNQRQAHRAPFAPLTRARTRLGHVGIPTRGRLPR